VSLHGRSKLYLHLSWFRSRALCHQEYPPTNKLTVNKLKVPSPVIGVTKPF
jgi:hypothetical protein